MTTTMALPGANCTIYVRNLEERIKIPELIDALREIFAEYGNIIDIVAKRNLKAKGQAFIVFDNPESAQRAIEDVQDFDLFDKPMKLDFARTRSDATVKRVGGDAELELHKKKRIAEKERKQALAAAEAQKLKRTHPSEADGHHPAKKPVRGTGLKSTGATTAPVVPDEYLPPNKILFVQNIPDGYDVDSLTGIFGRFEGFREVRLVPGRKGIAFVEYENETGAISAKEGTSGMVLEGSEKGKGIRVTYQRQ